MLKVHISSALRAAFAERPELLAEIANEFGRWQSRPDTSHYWFGRVSKDNEGLQHAHMIPANVKASREQWDLQWKLRRPWRRRSDRYVLFAHGGHRGVLLIWILDDPGAHEIWNTRHLSLVKRFQSIASNFIHLGVVP